MYIKTISDRTHSGPIDYISRNIGNGTYTMEVNLFTCTCRSLIANIFHTQVSDGKSVLSAVQHNRLITRNYVIDAAPEYKRMLFEQLMV